MKAILSKAILLIACYAIAVHGYAQEPPVAPSDLTATPSETDYEILLTWTDNSDDETGFVLIREELFNTVAYELPANTTSFTDTLVEANAVYYYYLHAKNETVYSDGPVAEATLFRQQPPAPENISVSPGPLIFIQISFTDNSDLETGYEIQHSDYPDQDGYFTKNIPGDTSGSVVTTYINDVPNPYGSFYPVNSTVYIRVRAFILDKGHYIYGPFSPVISAVTKGIPETPSDFTSTMEDGHIRLTWLDNSNHEAVYFLTRFLYQFSPIGAPITVLPADATSYTDTTAEPNIQYTYRLVAVDYAEYIRYPPQYWGDLFLESERVAETTGVRLLLPPAPTEVTAEGVSPQAIRIRFTDNSDYERWYEIEAATSPEGPFVAVWYEPAGAPAVEFEMSPFEPGTTYYLRVRGAGGTEQQTEYGPYSSIVSVTTLSIPGQQRLWGVSSTYPNEVFSMNTDGSDLQVMSFNSTAFGSGFNGFLQLSNGEVMVSAEHQGGVLTKIGPGGAVPLYQELGYIENITISGMAQGSNGKIYAMWGGAVNAGKFEGMLEFTTDGTSYVHIPMPSTDFSSEFYLTSTPGGTYGVSWGDPNNNGFVYKLNSTFTGTQKVYQFTGSEGGHRPSGKLLAGADGFLFGTTTRGGLSNKGSFFKVKEDGTQFEKLFDLAAKKITDQDGSGKFQTLLDVIAEGYRPATDEDGNYYVHGDSGIYKVGSDGFLIAKISHTPVIYTALITPAFQHVVKVSSIEDGATNLPTTLTIAVDTFQGTARYDLQISTSPDFAALVYEAGNEEPLFQVDSLDAYTTYYARARPNNWPYYGESISFTTGQSSLPAAAMIFLTTDEDGPTMINKDGSDPYALEISESLGSGTFFQLFQTTGEDLLTVSSNGGSSGHGTIGKITPSGFTKLYDATYTGEFSDIMNRSVEGDDGYIYFLKFSQGFKAIVRFKPDGTAYETYKASQPALVQGSGLTKASQGIFGVSYGVNENKGFIYKLKSDLSGVDIVYSFGPDSLGIRPEGQLLAGRDGFLYGTARSGGISNSGVIFKISQQGTQYTVLHRFQWQTGAYPESELVQDENGFIYGITQMGGESGRGVLFKIQEDGEGYQVLLHLQDIGAYAYYVTDLMTGQDGYLYGSAGGVRLFRIKTDGTGVEILIDGDDIGSSTPPRLIRQPFIPEVSVVTPEDQAMDVPVDLTIEFNEITGAAHYFLELSTSPDFSGEITTLTSEIPSVAVSGLEYSTAYYARIRSSLLPYYGEVSSFTTGSSAALAREAATQSPEEYAIYPNPSSNTFTLEAGPTVIHAISVSDMNGTVLYENNNPGTEQPLQFGEDLKNGIYILSVRTPGGVRMVRLVKK
jgi:uncharacterized repeat protein (TIGR03803 family)